MASTALDAGFHEAAFSGHDYVIQRTVLPRLRLPAIGGAIRAAARLGHTKDVLELETLGRLILPYDVQPFEASRFLLWAAESWHLLGEASRASPLLTESLRLAQKFGFHEIAIRAEELFAAKISNSASNAIDASAHALHDDPVFREGIYRLSALASR